MSMVERMHVTELCREHWPGTIINNVSSSSHVDALQYLHHSQKLVKDCQVPLQAHHHLGCLVYPSV